LCLHCWTHGPPIKNLQDEGEEMSDKQTTGKDGSQPHRVRLPGFVVKQEIGLGDAIKRATYAMGIRPCGGCERRATVLNRWVVFTSKE
jgi:hypothetical protein